jgi:hypothetical protein
MAGSWQLAEAQCVASPERPVEDFFLSDVVYPQERGEWQLELAPSLVTERDGQAAGLAFSAQYGVSGVWQLEANWDGPSRRGGSIPTWDVGNLQIGAKRSFPCVGVRANHASISFDLDLPTATGSTDRRIRIRPSAIFGRDVQAIHAHVFTQFLLATPVGSFGGATPTDATGTFAQCNLGMFVKSGAFRATGELTASRSPDAVTDFTLTPGIIWHSAPWEVGLGAMIPVSQGAGRGALFHVVYEFGGGEDEQ